MINEKFAISNDRYINFEEKINIIKQKIRLGLTGESSINPDLLDKALGDIIKLKFYNTVENKILKLISGGSQSFIINSVDGTAIIAKSKNVFTSGVAKNFRRMFAQPSKATWETAVNIYELTARATTFQIFTSLTNDLDSLCFNQHQIIDFCSRYKKDLKDMSHFLYKLENRYYIIFVYFYNNDLYSDIKILQNHTIFSPSYSKSFRFIIPASIL